MSAAKLSNRPRSNRKSMLTHNLATTDGLALCSIQSSVYLDALRLYSRESPINTTMSIKIRVSS